MYIYIYILSVLGSSLFIIAIVVIMINGFWTYTYSYILYIVAFIFAYEQRLPSVQTYMHVSTMHIFTYTPVHCYCRCCWRKESCTRRDVQDPVNNVINYQHHLVNRIPSINSNTRTIVELDWFLFLTITGLEEKNPTWYPKKVVFW